MRTLKFLLVLHSLFIASEASACLAELSAAARRTLPATVRAVSTLAHISKEGAKRTPPKSPGFELVSRPDDVTYRLLFGKKTVAVVGAITTPDDILRARELLVQAEEVNLRTVKYNFVSNIIPDVRTDLRIRSLLLPKIGKDLGKYLDTIGLLPTEVIMDSAELFPKIIQRSYKGIVIVGHVPGYKILQYRKLPWSIVDRFALRAVQELESQ